MPKGQLHCKLFLRNMYHYFMKLSKNGNFDDFILLFANDPVRISNQNFNKKNIKENFAKKIFL